MVNLTAVQDASSGSITLSWVPPMEYGDEVSGYDLRFKPIAATEYTTIRTYALAQLAL